jgi:hypothetical protein
MEPIVMAGVDGNGGKVFVLRGEKGIHHRVHGGTLGGILSFTNMDDVAAGNRGCFS